MNEIVERCAKAHYERLHYSHWEYLTPSIKTGYIEAMRAAIKVLREPAEEMVDAYVDAVVMDARGPRPLAEVAPERWAAMLDAALKERD